MRSFIAILLLLFSVRVSLADPAPIPVTSGGGGLNSAVGTAPLTLNLSGSDLTGSISQANTSTSGYISATDWNTFNGKQAAGNYITALTGDVSAAGPGSSAATLATVNGDVGSFGSATQCSVVTVNAKGLITAASNATVTPAVGSITGLGTGIGTWLATPSSANLATAITDETGSGKAVFDTSPTLVTPVLGVATATSVSTNGSSTQMGANSFTANAGNTTGSAFTSTSNTSWTTGAIFNGATSSSNYTGTSGLLRMTYSGTNSGVVAVFNTSNASASGDTFRIFNIGSGNTTKFGYDTSNYYTSNITSTGVVTFDAVGSGAKFNFSDAVQASDYYSGDGTQGITNSTSYWLCTSSVCATTCQVTIKDGLITGCT